jgi:hypothetical protein
VEVMRHTLGGNEAGMYHVVRTLPPNGVENQYRLKSQKDGHERVVLESRMRSGAAI